MAVYLEEYLESIENLPAEIRHHLNEIRVRNEHVNNLKRQINELQKQYLTKEQSDDLSQRIMTRYEESRELCDEKIAIAEKSIDLLNRHLKRLDGQIAAASKVVEEQGLPVYDPSLDEGSVNRSARKLQKKGRPSGYATSSLAGSSSFGADEYDGADSEEETNEPVYCVCQQESYGEMIACDNSESCPFEWFHYGCVGLNAPPQGAWYCPICAPKFRKKKF